MNYEELTAGLDLAAGRHLEALIAMSDDLFDHPEISGQEFRSSKKLVDLLKDNGFSVQYPFAGYDTAFMGICGKDSHARKVAVLAEYDALPQIGHACGHCLSAAISALAAIALKNFQDQLDADIHIIGTPSEETDGAKFGMIQKGVFERYDMAVMAHMYNANLVSPRLQAIACYEYVFHGKAAHASTAPWKGINALNSLQLFYHVLDMMRQHVRPDAQFHEIIRDGGQGRTSFPSAPRQNFTSAPLTKRI